MAAEVAAASKGWACISWTACARAALGRRSAITPALVCAWLRLNSSDSGLAVGGLELIGGVAQQVVAMLPGQAAGREQAHGGADDEHIERSGDQEARW